MEHVERDGIAAGETSRADRGALMAPARADHDRVGLRSPARVRNSDALARWALIGLVAFSVLACVMMLWWPLGYDQGVFASNGAIVARGGAPYRDAWDGKGPLTFYMTAAIQLVFGANAWGLRVVDVGFAVLAAWLLRSRLRLLASVQAALAAAAAWPIFVASLTYAESAQFDLWVGVAMLAGTFLVTPPEGYGRRHLAITGALIGLASLVKPFYPAFLAVPGIVVLLRRRADIGAVARDIAVLTLGWAAPVAATLALLWWQGALRAALDVHILYNLRVYSADSTFSMYPSDSALHLRIRGLVDYLKSAKTAVLLAPMAAGMAVLWRRQRVLAAAVATWLITGVGLILLQNKFWPYHWNIVYPAVMFLIAIGLHALFVDGRRTETHAATAIAVATTAVLLGAHFVRPANEVKTWLLYVTGQQSEASYYDTFLEHGHLAEQRAVASYIQSHTRAGEPFAHWTIDGVLSFMAGRPNVSRFQNKRELTITRDHPITQAYRREYLERVRTVRPTYIVVGQRGDLENPRSSRDVLEREFPELAALVAERYVLEATYGMTDIYRLRGTTTAPPIAPPATTAPIALDAAAPR